VKERWLERARNFWSILFRSLAVLGCAVVTNLIFRDLLGGAVPFTGDLKAHWFGAFIALMIWERREQ
jgi:hypothetical protein